MVNAIHKRDTCGRSAGVCPSVCLSVCHTGILYQNGKRHPYTFLRPDRPIILISRGHPVILNSLGKPLRDVKYRPRPDTGISKIALLDWNRRLSRKRYEIYFWVLWNVNRKPIIRVNQSIYNLQSGLSKNTARTTNIQWPWKAGREVDQVDLFNYALLPFDLERPNSAY